MGSVNLYGLITWLVEAHIGRKWGIPYILDSKLVVDPILNY